MKHPPFPFSKQRDNEIRSGKKPMNDSEREQYLAWMRAVSAIKSAAGRKGGANRWKLDETVSKMLKQSGGRGLTCHEIAAELHQEPKAIGRSLARLADKLDHMNSERDGQKVILWTGRESHRE